MPIEINKINSQLIQNVANFLGWRTNKKIIVIESDDWGSIRMPSMQVYEKLCKHNFNLNRGAGSRYNRFDTLASKADLADLFETLTSVKDSRESSAKITAVSLSANPDFEKMKNSGYEKYFYEPFTETLERYGHDGAFELWRTGYSSGLFFPEFHGREHLNVKAWLRALQARDREAIIAFDHGLWGYNRKSGMSFQAAFDLEFLADIEKQALVIEDGLQLFETLHGFRARFFVPPNGPINNRLEGIAAKGGIEFMSSPKIQREALGGGKTKTHFRYLGKTNKSGQRYITRNAFFEPSGSNVDEVDKCLAQIQLAFRYRKPAVISSHRVNFIGGLSEANRDYGLAQLKKLLATIVKTWPGVEFMSSSELGKEMRRSKLL